MRQLNVVALTALVQLTLAPATASASCAWGAAPRAVGAAAIAFKPLVDFLRNSDVISNCRMRALLFTDAMTACLGGQVARQGPGKGLNRPTTRLQVFVKPSTLSF